MVSPYTQLGRRLLEEGEWIYNERTGKSCLTIINADLVYDVGNNVFPIDTTRKSYWKAAVAEMLGYLKAYNNAYQFADLGAPTWLANANDNKVWLKNPHRRGEGDMGAAYMFNSDITGFDGEDPWSENQIRNIYRQLKSGSDDRGLIMTAWLPVSFHMACLRPCMHTHHFSLVNGTLHLTSYQRSCDVPLGLNFNMIQCFFLLKLMAQITGHEPGNVYHKITNAHVYEDQYELFCMHMERDPLPAPEFFISEHIESLSEVIELMEPEDCWVEGYEHLEAIKYPFSE